MTVNLSLIQDTLSNIDQLLLLERSLVKNEDYTFTFVKSVPNPRKALTLGSAREVDSSPKEEYLEEYKTYLKGNISELIEGLELGIIEQCKKYNTKKVIILLPESSVSDSYVFAYVQEDKAILCGLVRIYFNSEE